MTPQKKLLKALVDHISKLPRAQQDEALKKLEEFCQPAPKLNRTQRAMVKAAVIDLSKMFGEWSTQYKAWARKLH